MEEVYGDPCAFKSPSINASDTINSTVTINTSDSLNTTNTTNTTINVNTTLCNATASTHSREGACSRRRHRRLGELDTGDCDLNTLERVMCPFAKLVIGEYIPAEVREHDGACVRLQTTSTVNATPPMVAAADYAQVATDRLT